MMRLSPARFPTLLDFDTDTWSHRWKCSAPGCHEAGTGYESRGTAQAIGQAHADTHVRGTW